MSTHPSVVKKDVWIGEPEKGRDDKKNNAVDYICRKHPDSSIICVHLLVL